MRFKMRSVAALLWGCCQCVGQGYGSLGGGFHLEEALGGVYDFSFQERWGSNSGSPYDDNMHTITLKSRYGRSFECRVPLPAQPKEDGEEEEDEKAFDPLKALAPMKGACLAATHGWWSYEICYGKEVKQFHIDAKLGRKDTSSLGTFASTSVTGPTSVSESFELGTACDETGKFREAVVVYTCQAGSHEQVTSIVESSLCVYKIQVVTNLLCPPSKSEARVVECVPEGADQAEGEEGDLNEASAMTAAGSTETDMLEAGDVWNGVYTCQGEQEFELRLIKALEVKVKASEDEGDHQEFSGVLGFKHTLARGAYRVRVVYHIPTRVLKVIPGPWVHKPRDFMPLGFKGSLDRISSLMYGVLPECENGPWWLRRQPARSDSEQSVGQVAGLLKHFDIKTEGLDLEDESWPSDEGVVAANADDTDLTGESGRGTNKVGDDDAVDEEEEEADAIAHIQKIMKEKYGADIQVKVVTLDGEEVDASEDDELEDDGTLFDEGEDDNEAPEEHEYVDEGGILKQVAGVTDPPVPHSSQKKNRLSKADLQRVMSKLTDYVEKANEKQEKSSAEAAALHGKRLRMEKFYRGNTGHQNPGQPQAPPN